MAINQLGFEQAATLIAALHTQVTGQSSIAPTDTASFVSMAQATLQAGYEPVLNAIGQVLGRTLIAVRPYSRKFKGLEMSSERWGGITRKINFGENALDPYTALDPDQIGDPTFNLTDGSSIDQYVVKKPKVLQTVYVGQNVYESSYTIFTKQLDTAFSSPAEFSAFMSGLMTHFSNEREQYLESLSRAILCNMIGAKKVLDAAGVDLQIIDLLAEYNTATGQSLTATTVKLPANYPAFTKWCYAYIQHVSELFTERTEMYQRPLTNFHIMRHTPKADQRLFMDADFLAHMTAEVLADTYHDNFLRYSEVEAVNFWQAAKDPNEVNVKPVYLNADCEFVNATDPVLVEGIVGVLMDRDAAGYNLADDTLVASPYNAKGQYYNLYNHVRIQLQNDLTEKAVVFCIGGSVNPNPPQPSGGKVFEGEVFAMQSDPDVNYAGSDPMYLDYRFNTPSPVPSSIFVTVDGVEVEIPRFETDQALVYGEFDDDQNPIFTNYPYAVIFMGGDTADCEQFIFDTAEEDTYDVQINVPGVASPEPERTTLYDGSVTLTVDGEHSSTGEVQLEEGHEIDLNGQIPNSVIVTAGGVTTTIPRFPAEDPCYGNYEGTYGEGYPVFITYPFFIHLNVTDLVCDSIDVDAPVASAGTFDIKIEAYVYPKDK